MNKAIMQVPNGMTSVSWGGSCYEAEDNIVLVPIEAVEDLQSHGLHFLGDRPESEEEALEARLPVLEAALELASTAYEVALDARDSAKARLDGIKAEAAKANGEAAADKSKGKGK